MDKNKSYKIEEAISMLRENDELVFEIREEKEKDVWYEYMLLIRVYGITGNSALHYLTKPKEGVTPYRWRFYNYIPFSDKIEWYISSITKKDIQDSIDIIGDNR